jgi:hypothetical protein
MNNTLHNIGCFIVSFTSLTPARKYDCCNESGSVEFRECLRRRIACESEGRTKRRVLSNSELGHLSLESDAAAWHVDSAETPKEHDCQKEASEQAILETLSSVKYISQGACVRLRVFENLCRNCDRHKS